MFEQPHREKAEREWWEWESQRNKERKRFRNNELKHSEIEREKDLEKTFREWESDKRRKEERDRETERQRDRETERQRDRET